MLGDSYVALSFPPDTQLTGMGTPDFLQLLDNIIAAGLQNQSVVQRVANVSRRAHAANRDLRTDLVRLAQTSTSATARSPKMRAAVEQSRLVARFTTPVLITGESGSGKEVLARDIHALSNRANRTFLQINCGALPEHLIESELFGHEQGAFTGAERKHSGIFERADRGTLLLDEVGDLPLTTQVKLLRVLQEGEFFKVGGEKTVKVDVRIIAATNRPLAEMVRDGSFREDLFYRLSVYPIEIAPLRDRLEDLPILTTTLLQRIASRLDCPVPPISRSILTKLRRHSWPGNIRELANLLEAALITGGGKTLVLPDIASTKRQTKQATRPITTTLESATRACIESALAKANGKIYGKDGAAAILDLHPATLQSKMRKLGIFRQRFVAEQR